MCIDNSRAISRLKLWKHKLFMIEVDSTGDIFYGQQVYSVQISIEYIDTKCR